MSVYQRSLSYSRVAPAPLGRFPNEIPIAGETSGCVFNPGKKHMKLWQSRLTRSLLFVGNPGAIVSPAFAENFAKGLKNCRLVQLSSGLHYLQEDHPDVIGATVKEWLIELGVGSNSKQKLTL